MLCTKREVLEHFCRNTNGCVSTVSDDCEEIADKIAQSRPPLYSGKKWHDDVSTSWVMKGNAFHRIHLTEDYFNTTRILGKSALNGWSLSEAEIEGRKQVTEMVKFLKKYVTGFENSYLMKIGTQIGIRESRRVIGKYILNAEDVLSGRHFEDGITCGSYDIDIHNPTGTGTVIKRLKKGDYYKIPYPPKNKIP